MTSRQIEDYLQDILNTIDIATQFVESMTFEEFEADPKTIFAVTRAIEIVGEASKNIPQTLRDQYSHIPWKSITGMRDKVIHQYFGVNLQVLWETAQQDLPALKPSISEMLNNLQRTC